MQSPPRRDWTFKTLWPGVGSTEAPSWVLSAARFSTPEEAGDAAGKWQIACALHGRPVAVQLHQIPEDSR